MSKLMFRKFQLGTLLTAFVVTAVLSLSFPSHVQSQFVGQRTWGGTSSGSANAQTVALDNYNLDVGVPVSFIVGFALTNTDVTTLNINSTGVKSLKRSTQIGIFEMVGGELTEATVVTVIYDGTIYRQINITYEVGQRKEFRGAVPQGYAIEDGSCFAAANPRFVPLNLIIGSTYGVCSAGVSRFPDSRGRVTAGADAQGSNGSANNLTTGINGCNAVLGGACFAPVSTVSISQLPTFTPTGSVSTPTITMSASAGNVLNSTGIGGNANVTGGGATYTIAPVTATSSAISFTGNPIGSGGNIFPFPPNSIVVSAIKL